MKHRNWLFVMIVVLLLLVIGYHVWDQNQNTDPDQGTSVVPNEGQQTSPVIQPGPTDPSQPEQPAAEATVLHLYYPYDNGTDFEIKEVTAMVNLKEYETPLERISELLKESANNGPEHLVPVLGPDAAILSVEVMKDQIVKVNVNRQFITQMNAGAALEGQILKCLVKTISGLYQAEGVLLRVNGEPYESGHYFFPEDEILYADSPEV